MSYRPDYHITPKKGWINDPNGFVFFNGEYHLYAQHNPYDTVWGPMHWLHFVSRDLHNWTEKGIALKPSAPYDKEFGCFSGSSIVKDDKLFVLYTGANGDKQVQCLAVSKDGYNFEKYPYNPVLDEDDLPDGYLVKDFRDPKIIFQNDTYYVLLAARHKDGYSSILLYKSKDLIHYEFVNVLKSFNNMAENGMVECPDVVFENGKACLIYSFQHPSNYEKDFTVCSQVGHIDLDKGIFVPTGEEKELEQGFVGYASHTLTKDKHNYYISWLHSWGINSPTAKEGYECEGWYDEYGKLLTTKTTYSFTAIKEKVSTYYARFEKTVTQTYIRQVKDGNTWSVIEGDQNSSVGNLDRYTYTDVVGKQISATAAAGEGYKFIGWYDLAGNSVAAEMLSADKATLRYTTTGEATY